MSKPKKHGCKIKHENVIYHKTPKRRGVLLVNLGTPDQANARSVGRYLASFLRDPRVVNLPRSLWYPILFGIIVPFRSFASAKKYQRIFDEKGSPLLYHTKELTRGLEQALPEVVVDFAMCYSNPSLKKAIQGLQEKGVTKLFVLPLYPQYSATTVGAVYDKVFKVLKKVRHLPSLVMLHEYASHPHYIAAIADQILEHWQKEGKPARLLLSYHGLPEKQFEMGDPYSCFCHKTTRLIQEALSHENVAILQVFQSQFGKSAWLKPSCEAVLKDLARQGHQRVDVCCPGFAVDCLETLDEIVHEYAEIFVEEGGGRLDYIPALNDRPVHVNVLKEVLKDSGLDVT